jgi:hypothetical protein
MFARNVSFRVKANMLSDYTRTFENDILPLLRGGYPLYSGNPYRLWFGFR